MIDMSLFNRLDRESRRSPSRLLKVLEWLGWFPVFTAWLRRKEELRSQPVGARLLFLVGVADAPKKTSFDYYKSLEEK
jgi:hypothetical protein